MEASSIPRFTEQLAHHRWVEFPGCRPFFDAASLLEREFTNHAVLNEYIFIYFRLNPVLTLHLAVGSYECSYVQQTSGHAVLRDK